MWPFKKQVPIVDKEKQDLHERLKAAEAFAPVGSIIEYLGVKMLVVSHHEFYPMLYSKNIYVPGLKLEWMDNTQRLQRAFMRDWEFHLCKIISTPENK